MTHYMPAQTKAARLRDILIRTEPAFLMEAHNGASARIVERAGFDGIWASGLSMSTALGVRDNNELSWSQVLDQLEYMADATEIPILVDGDTGFGNFNTLRRFVRKLSARGVAGVCIEDKVFPKTNSFIGDKHKLASISEFCGKIRAGKDAQMVEDFCIVARIEALIAGRPMEEALARADAYAEAGADAVVIHSRHADAGEILEFLDRWEARVPVVLIPTKYYRTPTSDLTAAGASAIVWANHNMRASLKAMEETSRQLMETQSLVGVEPAVYPLQGVFDLTDTADLARDEQRYEPAGDGSRAIVLAATRGAGFGELTEDRPKCMLSVRGHTILDRQVAAYRRVGIEDITVVTGYRADAVAAERIETVVNGAFAETGEAQSLSLARDRLTGPTLLSYGDVVFEPFFVELLAGAQADITLLVDPGTPGAADPTDRVICDPPQGHGVSDPGAVRLVEIGAGVDPSRTGAGQFTGLMSLSIAGARKLHMALDAPEADGALARANVSDVLTRLIADGTEPSVVYVSGNWRNVNSLLDLAEARDRA